jgi:hypothetical protein
VTRKAVQVVDKCWGDDRHTPRCQPPHNSTPLFVSGLHAANGVAPSIVRPMKADHQSTYDDRMVQNLEKSRCGTVFCIIRYLVSISSSYMRTLQFDRSSRHITYGHGIQLVRSSIHFNLFVRLPSLIPFILREPSIVTIHRRRGLVRV